MTSGEKFCSQSSGALGRGGPASAMGAFAILPPLLFTKKKPAARARTATNPAEAFTVRDSPELTEELSWSSGNLISRLSAGPRIIIMRNGKASQRGASTAVPPPRAGKTCIGRALPAATPCSVTGIGRVTRSGIDSGSFSGTRSNTGASSTGASRTATAQSCSPSNPVFSCSGSPSEPDSMRRLVNSRSGAVQRAGSLEGNCGGMRTSRAVLAASSLVAAEPFR